MPEANYGMFWTPEPPKKAPIIKLSCAIGDTDGYPAFDSDSDTYANKDDPKWGFLITGGAEFHMPLTVFQVKPDSLADKNGIRLGDIILEINEEDATQLTLAQAHEKIDASGKKIHFRLKNMDEDDPMGMYAAGEEKSIVMRVPKPLPEKVGGHSSGRIAAASIEARLREMQRKLSAIAEIPKILSSTLATVSQTFDKLIPAEQEQQHERQQQQKAFGGYAHRKYSYDEDAIDYELSAVQEVEELYESDDDSNDDDDDDDDDFDDANDVSIGDVNISEQLRYAQSKLKDVTPESDYASEANYPLNEEHEETQSDSESDYDNDTACSFDEAAEDEINVETITTTLERNIENVTFDNEAVFYLKLPSVTSDVEDIDDVYNDEDEDDDDDDDDENDAADGDFLSTTYTWNLRNVPKLRLNDEYDEIDLTLNIEQRCNTKNVDNSITSIQQTPQAAHSENIQNKNDDDDDDDDANGSGVTEDDAKPTALETAQKVLFKLDNMERAWPWADREKIIYKQSTCHLVPGKPLGLIEKRIQLLAKQHLLEKLQTSDTK